MLSSLVGEIDKPVGAIDFRRDPVDEEILFAAAKDGDEQAFATLIERYRRKILVVAFRFTHVREDAEDIAQQVFQKAFAHLRTFQGNSRFSTWLTRIAMNEALIFLRKGRSRRHVSIDGESTRPGALAYLEIPDSDPNPEISYLQQEEALVVSAAMRNLNPSLRKAVELRELEELSVAEVAEHMGLSVSAVKSRVFRGRKQLRKALRHYVENTDSGAQFVLGCSKA
jgi:RNA polymerase sigma-70 factor, ECF subfamily